jgi:hypothetical protein
MSESSPSLDLLLAIADVGVNTSLPDRLDARVQADLDRAARAEQRPRWHARHVRPRPGRALLAIAATVPVLIVAAVLLLTARRPVTTQTPVPAAQSMSGALQRAFPVLQQTRTPTDTFAAAPRLVPGLTLDLASGRRVFTSPRGAMWLIPAGAGEICLLGTHNLGAGCTTRIVATTRGFFSALQTTAGTTEIQGILPKPEVTDSPRGWVGWLGSLLVRAGVPVLVAGWWG